ncbi:MAG: hypothetical protein CMF48_04615 [Legionellales bacterium]|nr:hypothetical protein [Legionellales bacterium]|tara:strand:- start:294 stop:533 length:240 start_codon:yes stop_codon:yes gene_type:complete
MRNINAQEISAVSGGLGYWTDEVYYDCYLDTWTGVEYCDAYYVPVYREYSRTEEALIWSGVGLAAAAIVAGTTAAILLV